MTAVYIIDGASQATGGTGWGSRPGLSARSWNPRWGVVSPRPDTWVRPPTAETGARPPRGRRAARQASCNPAISQLVPGGCKCPGSPPHPPTPLSTRLEGVEEEETDNNLELWRKSWVLLSVGHLVTPLARVSKPLAPFTFSGSSWKQGRSFSESNFDPSRDNTILRFLLLVVVMVRVREEDASGLEINFEEEENADGLPLEGKLLIHPLNLQVKPNFGKNQNLFTPLKGCLGSESDSLLSIDCGRPHLQDVFKFLCQLFSYGKIQTYMK